MDASSLVEFIPPMDIIILICQYNAQYILEFSEIMPIPWHRVMHCVYRLSYDKSIPESDVKFAYFDKCTKRKLTNTIPHTVICLSDCRSKVVCHGDNEYGQLGLGDNISRFQLEEIKGIPTNILRVIYGHSFTLILLNDGRLFSSGHNGYGTLGLGDNINRNRFCEIKGVEKNIQGIFSGGHHIIILLTNGILLGCGPTSGRNESGGLGLGDNVNRNIFEVIKDVPHNIVDVACGETHTIIRLTDGTLMSCDSNRHGQLGQSDNVDRNTFKEIKCVPRNVSDIVCGNYNTFIKITDRASGMSTLMSCGNNESGQLGLDCRENKNEFESAITTKGKISSIYCYNEYTLIKYSDGKLISSGLYIKRIC